LSAVILSAFENRLRAGLV